MERDRAYRIALIFIVFSCISLRNILFQRRGEVSLAYSHHPESPKPSSPFTRYFSTINDISDQDYEIVTTNYGWNTPNASKFSRRKITAEFFNAVLSHPKYNSTAWEDLNKYPDPNRRIIAFMDIDTCLEGNYPVYAGNFSLNTDIKVEGEKFSNILDNACKYIKRAAESPALMANNDSKLILLDCGKSPFYLLKDVCEPDTTNSREVRRYGGWGNLLNNTQVIIAYYGIAKSEARPHDIGLPPPAIKSIALYPHERHDVESCTKREYLFSFQGRGGFRRERLLKLDNGEDVYVRIKSEAGGGGDPESKHKYEDVMRNSVFAGAPRGDCLFSYRFAEIMSAGAIPVVYANDWLPPFSSSADPDRVINWTKCALFVREGKGSEKTVDIIRAIPDDVRCEMQQCSLAFWDEFASSRTAWLKGILSWVLLGSGNNAP